MKGIKLMLLVLSLVLVSTAAFALPLTIDEVKVNGNDVDASGTNFVRGVEKDDTLEVTVEFTVDDNLTADLEDVQVEVVIRGYDHNDLIEDITDAFDAKAGVTYVEDLDLDLPVRMDQKEYLMRVRIEDANGETTQETYRFEVEADNHAIWIKDIMFNPNVVEAGRAFLTTVRVENVGNQDEDDGVRIAVSVPELGLGPVVDYIDELDEEESTTSEELFLRIPQCTEAGDYNVVVEVTYHDGDEEVTATKSITVAEDESCDASEPSEPSEPETQPSLIQATLTSQNVAIGGKGTIFPISITNNGNAAETYTVNAIVGDWGTALISPSNVVVVEPGQTKSAYVYITAKDSAAAGESMFAVSVSQDGSVVKDMTLRANLVGDSADDDAGETSVKEVLEIVLIVVLVLLVLLGLVIGFKKLASSDEHDDEDDESYY